MTLEISQLQTLVAVSRTGSFSKAAEELHVTQSAISQSIKNLEKKVKVRIFKRCGKKVVLTLEGEKLYVMGKKFLTRLEETIQEIQEDKNEMSGMIRIGTLMGIGKSWLGDRLIEFSKEYPDVSLCIQLGFPQALAKEFEKFYLDCIIVPESSLPQSGEKVFFCDEYITLVYPKESTFQIDESIDLQTLSSVPIIAFEHEDSLFFNWCRQLFGGRPANIHRRIIVNSHGKMLQAVSKGLGIAVLPTHVLRRSYYRNQVATLGPKFEVFNNRFYLVFHKESRDLLRMNILKEKILEDVNTLAPQKML